MVHRGLNTPACKEGVPNLQAVQAILVLHGNYILQLRDDKPGIEAPGQWSLFGGRIDKGEEPIEAIKREIYEELCISPVQYNYLWFADYFARLENAPVRSWFFVADVSEVWDQHILREGSDVKSFSFPEIFAIQIPPVMRETLTRFHNQLQPDQKTP